MWIVLLIAVALMGAALLFFSSGIWNGVRAYRLLDSWIGHKDGVMDLRLQAWTDAEKTSLDARLDWITMDQRRVFGLQVSDITVYFCDGVMYLENGKGYDFGDAVANMAGFVEQFGKILPVMGVQREENTFSFTIQDQRIDSLKQWLEPSMANRLPEELTVGVVLEEGETGLKKMTIQACGAGMEQDEGAFDVTLEVVCRRSEPMEPEQEVIDAIVGGHTQSGRDLTENVLRLLTGWIRFNATASQSMTLQLWADCGPLAFDDELRLHRWMVEDTAIGYVEKNGRGLYFTDQAVCTSDGKVVTDQEPAVDAVQMLGLIYHLCLNGELSCEADVFRLSLDQEGMEAIAYLIAPQAQSLNIDFRSGSLELVMDDEDIRSIQVQCDGSVDVLLTKISVGVGALITIQEKNAALAIPDEVLRVLVPPEPADNFL